MCAGERKGAGGSLLAVRLSCVKSCLTHEDKAGCALRFQIRQFSLYIKRRSLIHLLCLLSYDRSIDSSKRVLHMRSSALVSSLQHPLFSLRPSSSFLHLLPRLLIASIHSSTCPSITCLSRKFLRKM